MTAALGAEVALTLEVTRPFSAAPLLAYLGARAIDGVESVDASSYRRSLRHGSEGGLLAVDLRDAERAGSVTIRCSSALGLEADSLRETVARLVDADAPAGEIAEAFEPDPVIGPLVRRHPGVRIPGTVDPFELAVRAILGQQVSVSAAATFAGKIAQQWGLGMTSPESGISRTFPGPRELAEAPLETVGLSRGRAGAIRHLAAAVASRQLDLVPVRGRGEQGQEALLAVPGIGPWTAAYVALRALRDRDAIPVGDLGLRQALDRETAREVEVRAESWRPWRGYAAVLLWSTFLSI